MTIPYAIKALERFQGDSLTASLSQMEATLEHLSVEELRTFCSERGIDGSFMASATSIKEIAGQINVIIHAAGILCSLPSILRPGEVIQYVSLGAGNTGKRFDLETDQRVAEYKFIDWRGGPESIRQNSLFKDFYQLAEYETKKSKQIYVVGTALPLKFLSGGRSLKSVLSRYRDIFDEIQEKYGEGVTRVRDYYGIKKNEVGIVDVSPHIGRGAPLTR